MYGIVRSQYESNVESKHPGAMLDFTLNSSHASLLQFVLSTQLSYQLNAFAVLQTSGAWKYLIAHRPGRTHSFTATCHSSAPSKLLTR